MSEMAERVGFEPTCPLLAGKTLSRRPRYDHFGTSPRSKISRARNCLRLAAVAQSLGISQTPQLVRGFLKSEIPENEARPTWRIGLRASRGASLERTGAG